MKIDTINGWFRGVGDICCFAWMGEGMIQAGEQVEFYATDWRAEMLKMFQMPVTGDATWRRDDLGRIRDCAQNQVRRSITLSGWRIILALQQRRNVHGWT